MDPKLDPSPAASRREEGDGEGKGGGGRLARNILIRAACLLAGVALVRRLTKRRSRWDHAALVAESLCGEKTSAEQATRDPDTYFNLRLDACPAATLTDGSRVLYYEQAFWRTPEKPFRQRLYLVKPCAKDMRCDVEVGNYAVRDAEEYRNFCKRPKNQRPQSAEIERDVSEHLTTVYLSACERGSKCLYEGSTPPGGFPNTWNGATRCTSELTVLRNGEVHYWDRGYDENGKQVWGPQPGPYEFKSRRFSPSLHSSASYLTEAAEMATEGTK